MQASFFLIFCCRVIGFGRRSIFFQSLFLLQLLIKYPFNLPIDTSEFIHSPLLQCVVDIFINA